MYKYKNLVGEAENAYLIKKFGMTFQDIMDMPENDEKEQISEDLMFDLQNDDEDHEASLFANKILINWGRYEHGMIEEDEQ